MATLQLPPVSIANHIFSREALQTAVDEAERDHPGKANVVKGSVDANGVSVALVLGNEAGTWDVKTAFSKNWDGSYAFGATGSFAW